MTTESQGPIRVALVNDYDVVVLGLARILERYDDRLVIAEIDTNKTVEDVVDLVLYDSFAQPESDRGEIAELVANPRTGAVVVYTWNLHPRAGGAGADSGSPWLPLEGAACPRPGGRAGGGARRRGRGQRPERRVRAVNGSEWPGREEGLTDRESEVLALITQGMSNAEVADLTYLSPNTIKTYIRSIYRKIEVESRTKAVLWGVEHGFQPDKRRIEHWRGGP